MKNSCLVIVGLLSILFSNCGTDQNKVVLPQLQLVSPDGVRIAGSVDELKQFSRQLIEDKHGAGTVITINKVNYKMLRPSSDNSVVATVYYQTSAGRQDHFDVYKGLPEIINQ